jgi:murein DD-endopeptidase MepM/ murein hydrolase activator NlpD
VWAVDGQPDRPAAGEAVHPFGNHVVIEHDGSVLLYLCHLARDSVAVRAGDAIAAGDPVGVVGTSGRSTEPHLHLHAVRPGAGPVPLTMAGRPLWRGRLMSAPRPGCRSTPGSRTP